jgi:hypothetical protein
LHPWSAAAFSRASVELRRALPEPLATHISRRNGVRVVRGVLSLVAAESTAKLLLLALGTLVHEATCALGATEAASALGSHAEATETLLHAGRGLTVPSARVRLVAELTERSRG